ncbi:MAG: hypothetical protein AABY07_02340 [Nanoarchaeota archaeon]
MVNFIEKIIKVLNSIKSVEGKIKYIKELIELKSVDDRIIFLEEISKRIKDSELNKMINILLSELKFTEEFPISPARFPAVEEEKEVELPKPSFSLENVVERERREEVEGPKEYLTTPTSLYESTIVENTPLLSNIRRDLERKGLFREDMFLTTEQRTAITQEIEKYSPTLSPERVNDYVNLLSGMNFEKYQPRINIGMHDLLEPKKEKTKYIKHVEVKW